MKLRFYLLLVLILIAASITQAQEKPDERLKSKITYYSGYVRLSDAVADISALTGIKIYSGTSTRDWQIRDLPVVICANDIEIGKLLEMITKAYYLTLNKEPVDGKNIYRIYRSKAQIKDIADYVVGTENYTFEKNNYDKSILFWIGSLDDKQLEEIYKQISSSNKNFGRNVNDPKLEFNLITSYAKLFNSFKETDKGIHVDLANKETDNSLILNYVNSYLSYHRQARDKIVINSSESWLDTVNIEKSSFDLNYVNDSCNANIYYCDENGNSICEISKPLEGIYDFAKIGEFSPAPKLPKRVDLKLNEYIRFFEYNPEYFKESFKISKPNKKEILWADAITQFSKISGYSIVSDDFEDHRGFQSPNDSGFFEGKKTIADVYKNLNYGAGDWYINQKEKSLIIKTNAFTSWMEQYYYLIPKTFYNNIVSMANGNGLVLLDFMELNTLSKKQIELWIHNTNKLEGIYIFNQEDNNRILAPFILQYSTQLAGSGIPAAFLDDETKARIIKINPAISEVINKDNAIIELIKEANQYILPSFSYKLSIQAGNLKGEIKILNDFPIYSTTRKQFLIQQAEKAKNGAK